MSLGWRLDIRRLARSNTNNLKPDHSPTDGEITETSDKKCRDIADKCRAEDIQIRCIGK